MVFQATPEEYFRKFAPKNFTQAQPHQPQVQYATPYADTTPPQTPPVIDPNVMIFCVTIVAIIAVVALALYREKRPYVADSNPNKL